MKVRPSFVSIFWFFLAVSNLVTKSSINFDFWPSQNNECSVVLLGFDKLLKVLVIK